MPRAYRYWRYNIALLRRVRGYSRSSAWAGVACPQGLGFRSVFIQVSGSGEERKGWQRDVIWRRGRLRGLRRLGGRLWVMYGSHARGLEFGEVEPELVFHSGEGGRG